MSDVQESVSVPQSSSQLANALSKFMLDVIQAKKSGASGAALVAAIGAAAVSDLAQALPVVSGIEGEIQAEPIGVAEAFMVAGIQVARQLSGK